MNPDFDYTFKCVIIGDSGVGKSSMLLKFVDDKFNCSHLTTIGIDLKVKIITVDDKKYKLQLWDTAGQEKFRSIVATYFKSCQGVILVFDLSNGESWENIKNIWYELAIKRAPTANYLLLGNKKDL